MITAAMQLASSRQPVLRIAVFRALMLGDMLCAVPALRAVRRAYPRATISWIGLEPTRSMAMRLGHLIDAFIAFPGHPDLPEIEADPVAWPGFMAAMRAQRFDLALQLHGSGRTVNAIVDGFDARFTAGFYDDPQWLCPGDTSLFTPWPATGHETERLLALTDHLGLPRAGTRLEFPLQEDDLSALARRWPQLAGGAPYLCVHPGAQLPSRRWPAERFAAVADAAAAAGLQVVLTGTASEAGLTRQVQTAMRAPALDLAGATTLGQLGALIAGAAALVCNDTSVQHMATALGCRSVVVSNGADVARWAPPDPRLHSVLWHDLPCRPCAHRSCPIGHPCALAIEPAAVVSALAPATLLAHRQPRAALHRMEPAH